MENELFSLLNPLAEAFHLVLSGEPATAIVYRLYMQLGTAFENGRAIKETLYYEVTVNMLVYDNTLVEDVRQALRGSGWTISGQDQDFDPDKKYYQHIINCWKERKTNENHGS